jgi:hypothetical protein
VPALAVAVPVIAAQAPVPVIAGSTVAGLDRAGNHGTIGTGSPRACDNHDSRGETFGQFARKLDTEVVLSVAAKFRSRNVRRRIVDRLYKALSSNEMWPIRLQLPRPCPTMSR